MEVEIENFSNSPKKIKHNSPEDEPKEVIDMNAENSNSMVESAPENDENDAMDDDCIDDDDCEDSDYDQDYFYDNGDDDDDDDDYLSMQAQFDNVDLPPGVEATVSWLKEPAASSSSSSTAPASVDVPSIGAFASSSDMKVYDPSVSCTLNLKNEVTPSLVAESSSSGKKVEEDGDEVARKYESFKRFDVVDDHSDHHYSNSGFQGQQKPSKEWMKKVQDEWKILEKDLPDTIYVRVYESRMDILRAVIVGPQGTPYHDGLFVFDVLFPPDYPAVPPMVYYYSGGLRLNPNLYDCGKVCLSLLNTWTGKGNEKWLPQSSTMLQVLVSIQALILNANPFFNEPGYESRYLGKDGENKSNSYNEEVFILSLKTMMYTLRRPPRHFEDYVIGHFRRHAHDILSACRAYMDGAIIGSLVNGKVPDGTKISKKGSDGLKSAVGRMINGLISNFSRYGVPDCEQFRPKSK